MHGTGPAGRRPGPLGLDRGPAGAPGRAPAPRRRVRRRRSSSPTGPTVSTGCASSPPTTSPATGSSWGAGDEVGCLALSRNRLYDADRGHGLRRVLPAPADLVVGRPAHRRRHRGAPRRGAGLRPRRLRGWSGVPSRRRTARPVPAMLAAAPRHPAGRHRRRRCSTRTAPTRPSTSPSGTPACPALLDRGVVWVHAHDPRRRRGRSPLVARRAAARTSSTPSTTSLPWPTDWRATDWSTAAGSPPAASAPAACCRARCSASAPTAGGRWSPRCRSSTWSPRCSTPRSR